MKVIQFIDAYYPKLDGVVTVVDNYAKHLNKNGVYCAVAAPDREQDDTHLDYPVYRYRSMEPTSKLNYHIAIPILDDQTHRKIIREKVDLVHAHTPFTLGTEAYRIATRLKVPLIASFHSKYYDDIYNVTKSEIMAKWGTQFIVNFYNKCDFVWTVNNATAETLRSYGFEGSIEIMPNGVDCIYPSDAEDRRKCMREKYCIDSDTVVFLFVGQQDIKKNIELILKGAAKYKREKGDFKLILVGEGPDSERFKEQAKNLGIFENCIFTGLISDKNELNNLYLGADLFLFPSLYDNASLVVREASAMHLPCVLVDGSNTAEGIEHKNNGYLCKNDTDSFYNCIAEALGDSEQRRQIGINASKTVCQDWDSIIEKVQVSYEKAIAWKKSVIESKKRKK